MRPALGRPGASSRSARPRSASTSRPRSSSSLRSVCGGSCGAATRQEPNTTFTWSSGVCVRMTLGGNSESGSGQTTSAVERDLVRRRRARREPGHVHERVVVALDAERLLARRLDALGAHFDLGPGASVCTQIVASSVAGVPQQRAEQKVHRLSSLRHHIRCAPRPDPASRSCSPVVARPRPPASSARSKLVLAAAGRAPTTRACTSPPRAPTTRAKASSCCCQGKVTPTSGSRAIRPRAASRSWPSSRRTSCVLCADEVTCRTSARGARRRARAAARLHAGAARARRGDRRR